MVTKSLVPWCVSEQGPVGERQVINLHGVGVGQRDSLGKKQVAVGLQSEIRAEACQMWSRHTRQASLIFLDFYKLGSITDHFHV